MNSTEMLSLEIRIETARLILNRGYGHLGSMSIVETLAVLYDRHMEINQDNIKTLDKNWFVLSKGHSCASYYSVLAIKNFFPKEMLMTFNENNTKLPAHPDRNKTVGVDCSTGSLGQGISQAVGIALGLKILKKNQYVYCVIGDGECNEGEVWEAFFMASQNKLNNLIIFIDNNKKQSDGFLHDVGGTIDYEVVLNGFGFYTQHVDGHNIEEIDEAINKAKNNVDKCSIIVLETIKGYGLSYFEKLDNNHHIKINNQKLKEILIKDIERLEKTYELEANDKI